MPQGATKEIEIQGVGRFQVPSEYTDAQVRTHILKLKQSKPDIFLAKPEDVLPANATPNNPPVEELSIFQRFMRGLTSRETPLPTSPFESAVSAGATAATGVDPTGGILSQLFAGTLNEASQGMRRGAMTLNEGGEGLGPQVKSAAQALAGELSPIISPGAVRTAGARLGEGDVAGAFGEMTPTAATFGVGALLKRGAAAIKGEAVTVRGKPFPLTAEGVAGGSSDVVNAAKRELSNIAAETAESVSKKPLAKVVAQVGGAPSVDTYIQNTKNAARTIKDVSQDIYKEITSVTDSRGNPILVGIGEDLPVRIGGDKSSVFMERQVPLVEALEKRSQMWKDVYRTRDADQRRIASELAKEFDQTIDDSLRSAKLKHPDLADKIDEAQALWRKGSALDDWGKTLDDATVGFPQHEVTVPGSVPARLKAGKLIESIKDLETQQSGGAGRLAQAVGLQNAQAIKDMAQLLANEEAKGGGLFGGIARLYFGARGIHGALYERLGADGLENLGRIVISKGIAYPQARLYLKNAMRYGANTAEGTYWLTRAVTVIESGDVSEPDKQKSIQPGVAP